MPLYEYECDACHQRFERIQKYSDPPIDVCAKCGKGPVRKLFSSPAIQFKGSGFYITDYARKSSTDAGKTGGDTSSSTTSTSKSTSESSTAPAEKSEKSSDKSDKKP
jgi:putative FmdB family regulatory protein